MRILAFHPRLRCIRWSRYSPRIHTRHRSSLPLLPPPPRKRNRHRYRRGCIWRHRLPPPSPITHPEDRIRMGHSYPRLRHALPQHHRYPTNQIQHPTISQSHFTSSRHQDPPSACFFGNGHWLLLTGVGTLRTLDIHH